MVTVYIRDIGTSVKRWKRVIIETSGNWAIDDRVTSGRLETQTVTESLISRSWTRRRGRNNADIVIIIIRVREKGVT